MADDGFPTRILAGRKRYRWRDYPTSIVICKPHQKFYRLEHQDKMSFPTVILHNGTAIHCSSNPDIFPCISVALACWDSSSNCFGLIYDVVNKTGLGIIPSEYVCAFSFPFLFSTSPSLPHHHFHQTNSTSSAIQQSAPSPPTTKPGSPTHPPSPETPSTNPSSSSS